jgi:transmembrane sensor
VILALWSRHPRNASAWFARLRRDDIPSVTDSRFRRWLRKDPGNETRYEQQQLIWKVAGELEHDQDIQTLLESIETPSGAAKARSIPGGRLAFVAVACALALFTLGLVVRFSYGIDREQLYATRIGEERTIVLPDHSTMTLNTATRVRVSYAKSRRIVILEQGEATFSVVHDLARAFEVTAAGGTARALGTQFNVLATGKKITVAVLEGRVAVTAARDTTEVVGSGEQVTYAGAHLDRPEPANIARIRGWHAGRIVLNDVELGEAISEFNRYSRLPLQLANPALAAHRITGVFRSGETEAFLDALEEAVDVHIERTHTAIILK